MGQIRKFILEQVAAKKISIENAKEMLGEISSAEKDTVKPGPIAIIGMAGKFPGADNRDEFWSNLIEGKDCVTEFPEKRRKDIDAILKNPEAAARFGYNMDGDTKDAQTMYRRGGYLEEVDKFDADFFNITPKEAQAMDPHQRLFLESAYEAIEDAGYGGEKIYGTSTGVFVGRDHQIQTYYDRMVNDRDMLTLLGSWSAIMPSRLSFFLDLRGPSIVFDTACSSAMVAVHNACLSLWNQECTMAIAGGVTVGSGRIKVQNGMTMVESDTEEIRSFDRKADGTVWSEGLGAFLLKPLKKAVEDKDHIYAVIKGSAVNNDGFSNGITAPNLQAQKDVLIKAWKNANITPDTLSYIEAHGTGTNLGDPIEIKALTEAMRAYTKKKQFCGIGSVKTNLGHLQASSGVASIMKTILSLQHRQIPPTIHFAEPNPYINLVDSPVYISDTVREWEDCPMPRRAGVSAFGLSGTNCHMVLEEYIESEEAFADSENEAEQPQLITFSAKRKDGLERLIKNFISYKNKEKYKLEAVCYTENTGRGHYDYRVAVIARSYADLQAKLEQLITGGLADSLDSHIYYGEHHKVIQQNSISAQNDITEKEARMLSDEAAELIREKNETEVPSLDLLDKIAAVYVKGASISWEQFYQNKKYQKVSLPAYPYQKKRFWASLKEQEPSVKKKDLFEMKWIPEKLTGEGKLLGDILVFREENTLTDQLVNQYRAQGYRVIEARVGDCFVKENQDSYQIRNEQEDYRTLLNEEALENVHTVLHLLSIGQDTECSTLEKLHTCLERGVNSCFRLIKAFHDSAANKRQGTKLAFLAKNVYEVTGEEGYLMPEQAVMFGLVKAAALEFPDVLLSCIDIDEHTKAECIIDEISAENSHVLVSYRNNNRYVEEMALAAPVQKQSAPVQVKDGGVYLITGGTGGIGLEVAKHFASLKKCTLVLMNRSKLPDRKEWSSIIRKNDDRGLAAKLESLLKIEELGAKVSCYQADISDYEEMEKVLGAIRQEHGKITGIVHSAGIPGKGYLSTKSMMEFNKVLMPKVMGTWNLDRLTRADHLDFFIGFSSAITVFGSGGKTDYIAANSYLDAFSAYRNRKAAGTVTINWPTWRETGMAYNEVYKSINEALKAVTNKEAVAILDKIMKSGSNTLIDEVYKAEHEAMQAVSNKEAAELLDRIMKRGSTRVIAGKMNLEMLSQQVMEKLDLRVSEEINGWMDSKQVSMDVQEEEEIKDNLILTGNELGEYSDLEKEIAAIWYNVLGYDEMDIHRSFYDLGGDSITVTKLHGLMEKHFPKMMAVTDIFSHATISEQAAYIQEKMQNMEPAVENPVISSVERGNIQEERKEIISNKTAEAPISEVQETEEDGIAIIGMCTRLPLADDYRMFWNNLADGKDCVSEFPEDRRKDIEKYLNFRQGETEQYNFRKGGYLSDIDKFDYSYFNLSPVEAQTMDPSQRLFMETTIGTIEDAGYSPKSLYHTNTGIYVGYGIDDGYRQLITDVSPDSASLAVPGNLRSMIPRRISYILNLRGPAVVVDTACSSSLVAVHYACQALKNGDCDLAIAGSVKINLIPQINDEKFEVQSTDGYTRSFDDASNGFGEGEGAITILLKPLSRALKDRDHIYSVIKGSAINQDGASMGVTAPNPAAQEELLLKAWKDAGIQPESLLGIETHGTGTKLGDPIEVDGLTKAFARTTKKKQFCALGAVKTSIGHLDHASGIAGLVKATLSLQNHKMPPLLHFNVPNRKIVFPESPMYVNDVTRSWDRQGEKGIFGVSSFGFSGTNCHVVVEEFIESEKKSAQNRLNVVCLSAKTKSSLNRLVKSYQEFLGTAEEENLEDICYTLARGREHFEYRLAVIASSFSDLKDKMMQVPDLADKELCQKYVFYSGQHQSSGTSRMYRGDSENIKAAFEEGDLEAVQELCRTFADGGIIPWHKIYGDIYKRVSLPVYAFDPVRCWPEYEAVKKSTGLWKRNNQSEVTLADFDSMTDEEKILYAWKHVLGVKEAKLEDKFSEFGGNSLLLIKMEAELEKMGLKVHSSGVSDDISLGELLGITAKHSESTVTAQQDTSVEVQQDVKLSYSEDAVVIQGIEPFNELFYRNCFFNALFPIIKYSNKSIMPLLMNDVVVYNKDAVGEGAMSLNASYLTVKSFEELLKCEAYQMECILKSADIIQDVKNGIDKSIPVIVWIDAFYEPIRTDVYNQAHRDHTLLVYGYDEDKQIFHIIEHENMDDLDYRKREISYADMQKCYEGYLKNYWEDENVATVYKIYYDKALEEAGSEQKDFQQIYRENIQRKKDAIIHGIDYIREFRDSFPNIYLDKNSLDQHIEENIARLNNIINIKKVQSHVFVQLFGEAFEGNKLIERILENWSDIRTVVVKYYYSQRYHKDTFHDLIENVDEIIQLEEQLTGLF